MGVGPNTELRRIRREKLVIAAMFFRDSALRQKIIVFCQDEQRGFLWETPFAPFQTKMLHLGSIFVGVAPTRV